jgi:phage/plasmid primase-like uncharacterized protein/phage/plasmid-associated DNA primase
MTQLVPVSSRKDVFAILKQHGYPTAVSLDGEKIRLDHAGSKTFWFFGKEFHTDEGKTFVLAHFGDWKLGTHHEYVSDTDGFTEAELKEVRAKAKAAQSRYEKERLEKQMDAARESEKAWEEASGPNGHVPAYFRLKKIPALFGCKTEDEGETLLVPTRDIDGKLHGIQRIKGDGEKSYTPGQRIDGCFHLIGENFAEKGLLYVCEGVATGASIHLATGMPVVCAFHAGNLEPVCVALRDRFRTLPIVVVADNDRWTRKPDGSPWNPGHDYAARAAESSSSVVAHLRFEHLDSKPTDANDLHLLEGLDKLAAVIRETRVLAPAQILSSMVRVTAQGKVVTPRELDVAERLIEFYDGRLCRQERDLFVFTGTHWKHLGLEDQDRIKQQIQICYGGQAESAKLESTFKMLLVYTPKAGRDMFTPAPWVVNFRNGSLFIERGPGPTDYRLEFRPHNASDFLVNVLPYDYDPKWRETSWAVQNPEFHGMLERVFEGDDDRTEKVAALGQMYGACLVPSFPHLFFCWGEPGTGKSTVMKIAARLVAPENMCSVEPHEFAGFNMETMAGKLVNIDTDVDVHKPIADAIVKKIEDRVPMRIRRKGVKDIMAPLPSTHIFGGNAIPKTLEGASRAHDRRWTFLGFHRVMARGNYNKEYASWCFERGPQGILAFALYGLESLLKAGGHFTQPTSGSAKMEEWHLETDVVGQFLRDVEEGEVLDNQTVVVRDREAKIERKRLWEVFKAWHEDARGSAPRFDRMTLYKRLVQKGFEVKTVRGVRLFAGLGTRIAEGADH